MSKRKDAFVVTHVSAPHPDLRKVQAALEIWQMGLAEMVMAGRTVQDEKPIARIQVRPRRLPRAPKASGGTENA